MSCLQQQAKSFLLALLMTKLFLQKLEQTIGPKGPYPSCHSPALSRVASDGEKGPGNAVAWSCQKRVMQQLNGRIRIGQRFGITSGDGVFWQPLTGVLNFYRPHVIPQRFVQFLSPRTRADLHRTRENNPCTGCNQPGREKTILVRELTVSHVHYVILTNTAVFNLASS